jgi:hypothetical protein
VLGLAGMARPNFLIATCMGYLCSHEVYHFS